MTVTYIGNATYRGLAADTKPTSGVATNALFVETDTRTRYLYNGTSWLVGPTSPFNVSVHKDTADSIWKAVNDRTGAILASHATNVASVINTALNSLTSGGTVFLKRETYPLETTVALTQHFTNLVGEPGTKLVPAAGTFDLITVNGNDGILRDFFLDCSNKGNGTGSGIRIGGTSQSLRTKIQNIFLKNAPTHGIYLDINSGGCFVNNCTVQSFNSPTGHGLLISSSSDHFIYDNDIGGYGNNSGVIISGGGFNRIHNNEIYVNMFGITFYLGNGNSIVNNNIQLNQRHGIDIKNDTATTYKDLVIANNIIIDNSTSATTTYDGIAFTLSSTGGFDRVNVTGNISSDQRAGGSKTQRYGLASTTALLINSNVSNNVFTGNVTGGALITGAATTLRVINNVGYNPIGIITNPFPATAGDITNVAAAQAAPTSNTVYTVRLTPKTIVITGGTVSQIAIDGQNTGLTSGVFKLDVNETINVTHSATPTAVVYAT